MKVQLVVEFWADGDETESDQYQLDCLKQLIEDCDSAGVSIRVDEMKVVKE
jgi:hypothetical protein